MVEAVEQQDELDAYQQARFRAAREAGLTRVEAARFAKNAEPLHTLWKLRATGCRPDLIARIVT